MDKSARSFCSQSCGAASYRRCSHGIVQLFVCQAASRRFYSPYRRYRLATVCAGAEEYIQETFDWLGLEFDESPKKVDNTALIVNRSEKTFTDSMFVNSWIRGGLHRFRYARRAGCQTQGNTQFSVRRFYADADAQFAFSLER